MSQWELALDVSESVDPSELPESIDVEEQLELIDAIDGVTVSESDADKLRDVVEGWQDATGEDRAAAAWLLDYQRQEITDFYSS